jgi:tRNA(Ile)-lysidine synthase
MGRDARTEWPPGARVHLRAVERALRHDARVNPGETVVVAVSGGADSVFLLRALHTLAPTTGLSLHVAHLDHGWRGDAAVDDATWTKALAATLGLPFTARRVDAPALAATTGISPETAARQLRYTFLDQTAHDAGASVIATGHTADDQVETILLALLRGDGPAALGGMRPSGPLPVRCGAGRRLIRPLLDLRRDALRMALRELGQDWREDATNLDRRLPRNRLRLDVIPAPAAIAPGYASALRRSASLAREAGSYVRATAWAVAGDLFKLHPEGGLRARRADFLDLHPTLRGEALRWAVAQLEGNRPPPEWAHVQGALEMVQRGRGGAVAWLSPRIRLRLIAGWVSVERANGASQHT